MVPLMDRAGGHTLTHNDPVTQRSALPAPMTPRILPADRPRALRATLALAATQLPVLAAVSWLKLSPDFLCDRLFGLSGGVVAMLTVSFLLPLSVLALCLPFIRIGLQARASGEFPPAGTPVWRDMPVLTGRPARMRAWTLLALAPACALLVVFGAKVWSYFGNGMDLAQLDAHFSATCVAPANERARQ